MQASSRDQAQIGHRDRIKITMFVVQHNVSLDILSNVVYCQHMDTLPCMSDYFREYEDQHNSACLFLPAEYPNTWVCDGR